MAKIKLNRDSGYVDHQRAYRVVIDGEKRAKTSNGESIEIVVEPGNHEILLKIDWLRSNTINFSINKGEKKEFDCGSSLRGARFMLSIFYVTFLWNKYLWLQESSNLSS